MPVRLLPLLILLYAALCYSATEAERFYESASKRYFAADYNAALIELKNALQVDPEHVPSLLLSGQTYIALKDYSASEDALIKARILGGDNSFISAQLAEAYFEQGKYRSVVDELSARKLSDQDALELLGYQAQAWLNLGNEPEAAATLMEADKIDSMALRPNLARVLLHMRLNELEKAEKLAGNLVETYPQSSEAFNSLGSTLHANGNLQKALESYGKALEIDPDAANPRVARAGILVDLNQYQAALADLEYMDEKLPFEPRAAYLRGLTFMKLATPANDYADKYLEEFRKCADIVAQLPADLVATDTQLQMAAALSHFSLGEFEATKEYLDKYLGRQPYDLGANRLLGNTLIKLNESARAIGVLRSTLQAYPNDAASLNLLATAYTNAGNHEKATELLNQLKSLGDNSALTGTRLAQSLLLSGSTNAGIEGLQEIFENDSENTEAGFRLVIAQLRDERTEEALKTIETLLNIEPDNATYKNLKGIALRTSGELSRARALFEEISDTQPKFVAAKINLAKTEELMGSVESARRRLLDLREEIPDNVGVLLAIAQLEKRQGKIEDALRLAENARQEAPENFEVRKFLIETYLVMDDRESAESLAIDTAELFDNDEKSSNLLADTYVEIGEPRKAISHFRMMTKEAGFNTEKLVYTADRLTALGARESARHALFKAITADPTHIASQVRYIRLQLALREVEDALKRALLLLEKAPGLQESHLLVGEAYFASRQYSEAEKFFEEGLRSGFNPSLLTGLYRSLVAQSKSREATAVLENYWKEDITQPVVGAALAELRIRSENWSGALEVMQTMLDLGIDSANLRNNMAYVLHKLGNPAALEFARRAHQLEPDNPLINDTLGWLLVLEERFDEALGYLRQAQARLTDNPEIRYHLAVALHQVGRSDEAEKELQTALGIGLPFEGDDHARELLKNLTQVTD